MSPGEPKTMLDARCWMLDSVIKHQVSTIKHRIAPRKKFLCRGFALYEVLIGVAIFAMGVLALGRAVENCVNASTLSAEEERVRQILSNRMAEIQTTPGSPDAVKEAKIDSGYGVVKLIQKSVPSGLQDENGADLGGINLVTLTAQWTRRGVLQSKLVQFYVYRPG